MAAATAAARDLAGDPPESTLLRVGGEVAWPDVYDRDDSLKENTNPKCILKTYGGGGGGNSSQRFSGNLKPTAAPIIGLSRKLGHGGGGGGGGGGGFRPPAIFPKKAKTGGGGRTPRAAVPDHEPGSPKVSCIGKVLSDRERARRHRRWSLETRPRGVGGGCCPGLGSLFVRRSRSRKNVVECVDDQSPPPPPPPPPTVAALRRREEKVVLMTEEAAAAPAPALGGMTRFASGRRAADWAAEMEMDGHVVRSGPL
uniref:Uncharacterized protein n=1 Tax=Oryza nivara TaxID=4536 RepID=A0A0E0J6V5_ORYNI